MNNKKIIAAIKREFLEHKKLLIGTFFYITVVSFVFLVYGLYKLSALFVSRGAMEIKINGNMKSLSELDFSMMSSGYLSFIGLIALVVSIYYLLSCLYDDRKDRSILFWKSMPVSEVQTVLVKLVFGLYMIPLLSLILGLVSLLVNALVISVWADWMTPLDFGYVFSGLKLFSVFWHKFVFSIVGSIWILPFFTWLLLASAYSKKSPLLIAVVPPLTLTVFEKVFFGSSTLTSLIRAYLPDLKQYSYRNSSVADMLSDHLAVFAQGPNVYWGLVVSVAFVIAAIWLRNNRYVI
ncbi:MAG: hypothetical protein K6L73_04795 [Cellvibrionaceae bacterium]